jgi:hypothetical protein
MTQMDMHGNNQDLNDAEAFGDTLSRIQYNHLRIMLQNINNLSSLAFTLKSRQLIDCMVCQEIDAFLMTEVGLNWSRLSSLNQWNERTMG